MLLLAMVSRRTWLLAARTIRCLGLNKEKTPKRRVSRAFCAEMRPAQRVAMRIGPRTRRSILLPVRDGTQHLTCDIGSLRSRRGVQANHQGELRITGWIESDNVAIARKPMRDRRLEIAVAR